MALDPKRLNTIARIRRFHVSEARRELEVQLEAEAQANLRLQQIAEQTCQEFEITSRLSADDPARQGLPAWSRRAGKNFEEARALCKVASDRVALTRQQIAHANGALNVIEELMQSALADARSEADKKSLAALIDAVSSGAIKLG